MTSGTKTGATRRTPPDSTLATLPNRSLRDQGRRLRRTREAARTRACPRRTGRSQRWRGPQASAVSACPGRVDAASAVDRGAECSIDRAEGSGCGAAACHLHATSHGPQGTTMVSTVSSSPRSCGRRAMSDPHLQGGVRAAVCVPAACPIRARTEAASAPEQVVTALTRGNGAVARVPITRQQTAAEGPTAGDLCGGRGGGWCGRPRTGRCKRRLRRPGDGQRVRDDERHDHRDDDLWGDRQPVRAQ